MADDAAWGVREDFRRNATRAGNDNAKDEALVTKSSQRAAKLCEWCRRSLEGRRRCGGASGECCAVSDASPLLFFLYLARQ
jgi:hypothetical protein